MLADVHAGKCTCTHTTASVKSGNEQQWKNRETEMKQGKCWKSVNMQINWVDKTQTKTTTIKK